MARMHARARAHAQRGSAGEALAYLQASALAAPGDRQHQSAIAPSIKALQDWIKKTGRSKGKSRVHPAAKAQLQRKGEGGGGAGTGEL